MQNFYMCPRCAEVYTYDELLDQAEEIEDYPSCCGCDCHSSNFILISADSFVCAGIGDYFEEKTKENEVRRFNNF